MTAMSITLAAAAATRIEQQLTDNYGDTPGINWAAVAAIATEAALTAARPAGDFARAREAIRAELDDIDPDCEMRNTHADPDRAVDPGHPGNSWWRTYCEVGGMMRALAAITEDAADG